MIQITDERIALLAELKRKKESALSSLAQSQKRVDEISAMYDNALADIKILHSATDPKYTLDPTGTTFTEK